MEETLLIFVPQINPRITYTFSLFFNSLINAPYRLTINNEEYKTHTGPKFCYADKPVDSGLFLSSSKLLFETGINEQAIEVFEWNGLARFFKTAAGALPFDIFAASFYLVTRYEEYLTTECDNHNRYKFEDSLACKHKFIHKPLVNLWAAELKKIILEKYPSLLIKESSYKFVPTIDIDVAYAHLGRTLGVTIGSALMALAKLKLGFVIDKKLTLLRLKKDAYDTYDYQEAVFKKHNTRPIYFFLAGNRAQYDKNISTDSKVFARLVKRVEKIADVGIHPSYQSKSKPEIVGQEIKRVEKNLESKITKSRQHFIRISLPETYQCLAKLNITDDYSLTYASQVGFRASICTPFYFYDLQKEETLPVKIHPTIIMEGSLMEYMQLNLDDAITLTLQLIAEVKNCNGEFICIWHNHSLNNKGPKKGWRRLFETMIEKGTSA
jgi:hypothetical protein